MIAGRTALTHGALQTNGCRTPRPMRLVGAVLITCCVWLGCNSSEDSAAKVAALKTEAFVASRQVAIEVGCGSICVSENSRLVFKSVVCNLWDKPIEVHPQHTWSYEYAVYARAHTDTGPSGRWKPLSPGAAFVTVRPGEVPDRVTVPPGESYMFEHPVEIGGGGDVVVLRFAYLLGPVDGPTQWVHREACVIWR
jgi:hypothetical protein